MHTTYVSRCVLLRVYRPTWRRTRSCSREALSDQFLENHPRWRRHRNSSRSSPPRGSDRRTSSRFPRTIWSCCELAPGQPPTRDDGDHTTATDHILNPHEVMVYGPRTFGEYALRIQKKTKKKCSGDERKKVFLIFFKLFNIMSSTVVVWFMFPAFSRNPPFRSLLRRTAINSVLYLNLNYN